MPRTTKTTGKVLGILSIVLLALFCGCSSWAKWSPRGEPSQLDRSHKMPLRKVARSIEVGTQFIQIQFDPADPDQLQSMWQWVDETVIPIETRRSLNRNGLRIGKVVQPQRLNSKLESLKSHESQDVVDQFLASASISSHQSEGDRIEPMRIGKRSELPLRLPVKGIHVPMVFEDGEVRAKTLLDPTFLLAITPHAGQSSAEISLRIRPEIQHGNMRQNWVQGDAALRIDVRRETWSLDSLEFELVGGEGDLFVVSETESRRGLGKMMLGGKNVDQLEQQTVLLLRIVNIPTPAEKL